MSSLQRQLVQELSKWKGGATLFAKQIRDRLRQCAECHTSFLVKRNHRRTNHFCCEAHRRAFGARNRDKKVQKLYMREYRKRLAKEA